MVIFSPFVLDYKNYWWCY